MKPEAARHGACNTTADLACISRTSADTRSRIPNWSEGIRQMADKAIPHYRCTSCLQALPEEQQQHLFGSDLLRPTSDEADNFVMEAQKIMRYSSAVALMLNAAEKIGEGVMYELHHLVGELTDEALRRLDRAQEALEIVGERDEAAKKAPPRAKGRGVTTGDSSFSTLYETVDYSLHKLTHILKSVECVNEQADPINEILDTLTSLALAQVEESRTQLIKLHKHHYAVEQEPEKAEA